MLCRRPAESIGRQKWKSSRGGTARLVGLRAWRLLKWIRGVHECAQRYTQKMAVVHARIASGDSR